MKRVTLFDSTLRDGAQGEGISFSVNDKLKILRLLDGLGIPYVEAGAFRTPSMCIPPLWAKAFLPT